MGAVASRTAPSPAAAWPCKTSCRTGALGALPLGSAGAYWQIVAATAPGGTTGARAPSVCSTNVGGLAGQSAVPAAGLAAAVVPQAEIVMIAAASAMAGAQQVWCRFIKFTALANGRGSCR